jgi:hypothetical protein
MEIKRRLVTLNNKTGEKIVSEIQKIIDASEQYRSCYFWTQTGNAASRRRQEFTNNLKFTLKNKTYEVVQDLTISCKNFYFSTAVTVNGKRSNITPLKNMIK